MGTMLPRRIPQELRMDRPLRPDPAAGNKQKRGAKTGWGEGLNPTHRVSAQHSPADPH